MSSLTLSQFPAYPYTVEEVISPDASYSGRNASLADVTRCLQGLNRYFDAFCRERATPSVNHDLGRALDLAQ